ncbi:uncharacterized protein LDX57_010331 [Aspergillus melleus]|uniref:uncharacterized protein n=1 Tax=Aspergillus melleus TaxID=138277 RepID=UPI001E8D4D39|nr:uncharacterized protein LDX57_010331 [Aspergillus melleus]KAH8432704.1 hypothetical protein LDX57_010331 [Aspergillus melleus]
MSDQQYPDAASSPPARDGAVNAENSNNNALSTDSNLKTKESTPDAGSTHSKSSGASSTTKNSADEHEWIQGIPLFMVLAGVTLVVFLMLLDVAILSTVGACVQDCLGV